ncbi:hypothetical protein AB1L42_04340 [Thalassoglobus sp. JC818]|uniref:hypothetical protein n=1 Tax=Thalassoglobus sp. JC818 TaxID=3232136 RepID=UPI003458470D
MITKTNNLRGLLNKIEEGMTTHLTTTYNDAGSLTGQTFGNSVSETISYINVGTVDSIWSPGGTFDYSYDANMNALKSRSPVCSPLCGPAKGANR